LRSIRLGEKIEDLPAKFFVEDLSRTFKEYLVFGGYPRVALEKETEKKVSYLTDIYNSYVKKDIKDIMRVDNVTAFNNLLKGLALQIGSLVNMTEICSMVKISRETLDRYLFLLENTFIIRMLPPFSRNPRKEISKMAKLYFVDTGLRNIIIRNLNHPEDRTDAGVLVENGVFTNMLKNLSPLEEIHFWRTLAKNEVDFINVKGNFNRPIEVKYSSFKSARVPLGIRSFQREYEATTGIVLTKDYFGTTDKTVFVPVWLC
jgi:predicted AAA+ superfamily ATPase